MVFLLVIVQCSNVDDYLFSYMQTCKPKLVANQSFASGNPINIIGFVSQPPPAFDLIVERHYTAYKPLLSIYAIQGKTPADFLRTSRFISCTGNLRLIDPRKIYIDTPSTYGFSGGPCFAPSNEDPYFFDGVLIGTTRIWNMCILLENSSTFKEYYKTLIKDSDEINSLKTDL